LNTSFSTSGISGKRFSNRTKISTCCY
jgi:hypothetical protein